MLKFNKHILYLPFLLVFAFASCSAPEKPADGALPAADSATAALSALKDSLPAATINAPTETFEGSYLGKTLVVSHKDFQKFTYKEGDLMLSGAMNTEKGYGDDRSATVYVLNCDKPKAEQKYVVRGSNGSVYLLDQDRFVVDDAVFSPVKSAPVVSPKSEAVKDKPVAVKNKKKKKTVTAKKASTKKAVKSKKKKKKKPGRKTRKKSSTKKTKTTSAKKEEPKN